MREYLKDPEFVRRYDNADIVSDQAQPASVRVSAARSLLEYGLRFTEFNDILRDLERLEGSCTTTI